MFTAGAADSKRTCIFLATKVVDLNKDTFIFTKSKDTEQGYAGLRFGEASAMAMQPTRPVNQKPVHRQLDKFT
jgi:hypothetical protein